VTALLTSHNRRDLTLASLRSFYSQRLPPSVRLNAVLVDDGSSDATESAVRGAFPDTHVIRGPGDLYWAGGMALAERIGVADDPDYLLWLNDDVTLDADALERLLRTEAAGGRGQCIVVGALRDPSSRALTYSGVRRKGAHPLRVDLVEPGDEPKKVEMFHGNVVLVSRAAYLVTGPIDGDFSHAQADFDYALRAAKAQIVSFLAPGTVGTCARDGKSARWLDRSYSVRERLQFLLGRKGLPPRSTARYLIRHGGLAWPLWWITPYARFALHLSRDFATSVGGRSHVRRERPDDTARIPGRNDTRWDVTGDDAASTDDGASANGRASQNDRSSAYEHVVVDGDPVSGLRPRHR
jgi:GT2 family glycosyltransferase